MARSDAVGKEPTIDEINAAEMAKFQGFSVTDGEVSKGEPTVDEKEALARQNVIETAAKAKETAEKPDEGSVDETAEEKAAREAAEANLTDKQKAAKALQAKVGGDKGKKPVRSAADRVAQINAATAEMRQAQRDLEAARAVDNKAEIAALKAEIAQLKSGLTSKPGATTVVDKDAPRASDYQYGELDAGYIRDLAVYETRKAIAAEKTKETATAQTEQKRREAQEFQQKVEKFETDGSEKFDDFSDVVIQGAKDGAWPLTKTFGDLMFESEVGPDIAYYLATHVDEAKKIMGKSPSAQAAAFGRLEATFSSTSSDASHQSTDQQTDKPGQATQQQGQVPVQGSTTKAPPPPQHRARGAGGKITVTADTNDFAAFERMAMSGTG